ncbi:MAG: pitrilysin family protein [Alphaproteobacteria bacterium]|nr:pitrilysin family protein [Alphaproteobacteria bacterium]
MVVRITELDNGILVATDAMPDAESVVTGVWVGVGTRHEPWRANGVAHLVEHMMFKGTKTRSAYALSSAIENKGGSMNAHTSREATVYYARVLPEETETALDVLSDMLLRSVFAPKELERERMVVLQEIGRDLDSPEDVAYDLMYGGALPQQTVGRPILGSAKVIADLPRDAVASYVRKHYVGSNMVLVAAGRVNHDAFVAMARTRFAKVPRGRRAEIVRARIRSGMVRQDKEIEQVHLLFAFAGPGYKTRASYYATQVMSLILGGSSSSRLFQKVREKRGLVYTVHSSHASLREAGLFQIYAGTDPKRLRELVPVICQELKNMQKTVTRGELRRAKAQVRAEFLMGRDSVMRRAEMLGSQMLAHGKPIPADVLVQRILSVDADAVKDAAHKVFSKKPLVTALGPLEALEPYDSIVARLA